MNTKLILIALAACFLISNASAGYIFDTEIDDFNEYTQQAVPIIKEFRSSPAGSQIDVNNESMNYLDFMDYYYENHPDPRYNNALGYISKGPASTSKVSSSNSNSDTGNSNTVTDSNDDKKPKKNKHGDKVRKNTPNGPKWFKR